MAVFAVADGGHIPASQQALLVRAHFLGGGEEEEDEEEEAEVFSTPPLTQQDPQRGQAGDGEDVITMCSIPFTPTQLSPPSPVSSSSSEDSSVRRPQKTRICTRKVRCGAKFRTTTPTPTPNPTPTPAPAPTPMRTPAPAPTPTLSPRTSPELDPLARMVLMIPTAPPPTISIEEFFELGRSRGVF